MNKLYTVSQVRERLSDALDEADRGLPVIIERRGTRYRLSLAPKNARPSRAKRSPRIEIIDPAIETGNWSWAWAPGGISFKPRRTR
jgi:antitoxin (DNA-binding transcriptional repressor) of toxin-antitoxin stability system